MQGHMYNHLHVHKRAHTRFWEFLFLTEPDTCLEHYLLKHRRHIHTYSYIYRYVHLSTHIATGITENTSRTVKRTRYIRTIPNKLQHTCWIRLNILDKIPHTQTSIINTTYKKTQRLIHALMCSGTSCGLLS